MAGEIEAAAAAATAQLAQMKTDYEASPQRQLERDREQLARLESDPFHQNKQLSSEAARQDVAAIKSRIAVAEAGAEAAVAAQVLTDAQRTALVIEGKIDPHGPSSTISGQIPLGDLGAAVEDFRVAGLNDIQINQAINGAKYHRGTVDAGRQLFEQRMSDPAWVAKLAAGDRATKKEKLLIDIVLNATIVADDAQADT